MKTFLFWISGLIVLAGISAAAQDREPDSMPQATSPEVTAEEKAKVRKRLYPGGRDEEPLQVQTQLLDPVHPTSTEESSDPADHD